MKKRWLSLLLALLVLAVGITACDTNDAAGDDGASEPSSVQVTLVLTSANEEDRIALDSDFGDPIGEALSKRLKNNGIDDCSMKTAPEDNSIEVHFTAESQAQAQEVADKLCPRGEVSLLFYEGDATRPGEDGSVAPLGVLLLDSRNILSANAMYMDFGGEEPDPQPVISLAFDEVAATVLAVSTENLAADGGTISIWLDFGVNWAEQGEKVRYRLVQTFDVFEPITEGEALLTGFEEWEEAEELADLITVNLLPFDLEVESIRFQ